MEFSDMNLTKDSSLLLHAIHNLFYWIFFIQKTILYFGFKTPYIKNPGNKKTRVFSWIEFVEQKNNGRKPDKN
jgi:hypothetical protein